MSLVTVYILNWTGGSPASPSQPLPPVQNLKEKTINTTQIDIHQIDAFTDKVFGGNPAAIVPLEDWLPDDTLQAITAENNLSDTVFYVADPVRPDEFDLR